MKQVNVRLPDDVHAKLIAIAQTDRRSLNSVIIVLIEEEDERRPRSDHPRT